MISSNTNQPALLCPLCEEYGIEDHNAGNTLHLKNSEFRILSCPICKIRWLNPIPSTEYLSLLYSKTYFEPENSNYSYQQQIGETKACFTKTAKDFYQKLQPHGPILDIGCATGDFLIALRELGLEGFGIELSSYAIEIARSKGLENLIIGDLFSNKLDEKIFSGIHISHVLEHLPNIHDAMKRIRSLIKADGIIYIEVPYQFDSLLEKVNGYLNYNISNFGPFSVHHCTFFTPTSLCNLLKQHGFQVTALTTYRSCRRANRPSSLRKFLISSFLWLSDFFFQRGDIISVWAKATTR